MEVLQTIAKVKVEKQVEQQKVEIIKKGQVNQIQKEKV